MKNPFRKPPVHPDIPKHEIEEAWKAGRETFYRFKDIAHFTTKGRGVFINTYLATFQKFRVTPSDFQDWKAAMRSALNPTGKGEVRLGLAHKLLDQLEEREVMFNDLEAAYKILALSTFKLTDDLAGGLAPDEEARRIALLKKKPLEEVLQMKPLPDFGLIRTPLSEGSPQLLSNSLRKNQAVLNAQSLFWMRVIG